MWAAISTIFVVQECKSKSLTAAIARMSATLISFVLCLVYLAFLPFHAWGLALLVALSVLVPGLVGRPGDEVTAAITTTVVMVVAGLNAHAAWKQPLLRLADTSIGVTAGIVTLVIVSQIGKCQVDRQGPHLSTGSISHKPGRLIPRAFTRCAGRARNQ
ncbi:FUSC family protein [Streptomyces sp. NPDC055692]|uniref:FUSC family protein n=1 Tax=Streptomyces sp. NPDC055692 TaxID=3155683 RepID=UPI00342D0581